MIDAFLFVGLPYVSLFVLVAGSIYRFRTAQFTHSALTSQFLESKQLFWGTWPWHAGIFVIFLGHIVAFLVPDLWRGLVSHHPLLLIVEAVGIAAACLSLVGLVVLLLRRLMSAKLEAVTTVVDFVILALLFSQVALGLGVAGSYRWGAFWSTQTTTPYLWSLLKLRPDVSYVATMPPVIKLHIVGAWIIFLMVPFSRLVHLFAVPVGYLFRAPQRVLWVNRRRFEKGARAQQIEETRRHFLRASLGIGAATVLLTVGVLDKLARFFGGPRLTPEAEAEVLTKKLQRLRLAMEERELELERLKSEYIPVAQLGELSPRDGKYFIDYQMRPALAFLGPDGLPLLISAKCTHLGCTVASTVDVSGRLLCPCHMSYFDIVTGQPNPGSPARAPLPKLGWVLRSGSGEIVASRGPDGLLQGQVDQQQLASLEVFIAKQFEDPDA